MINMIYKILIINKLNPVILKSCLNKYKGNFVYLLSLHLLGYVAPLGLGNYLFCDFIGFSPHVDIYRPVGANASFITSPHTPFRYSVPSAAAPLRCHFTLLLHFVLAFFSSQFAVSSAKLER